jgi:hypothetical protein
VVTPLGRGGGDGSGDGGGERNVSTMWVEAMRARRYVIVFRSEILVLSFLSHCFLLSVSSLYSFFSLIGCYAYSPLYQSPNSRLINATPTPAQIPVITTPSLHLPPHAQAGTFSGRVRPAFGLTTLPLRPGTVGS